MMRAKLCAAKCSAAVIVLSSTAWSMPAFMCPAAAHLGEQQAFAHGRRGGHAHCARFMWLPPTDYSVRPLNASRSAAPSSARVLSARITTSLIPSPLVRPQASSCSWFMGKVTRQGLHRIWSNGPGGVAVHGAESVDFTARIDGCSTGRSKRAHSPVLTHLPGPITSCS